MPECGPVKDVVDMAWFTAAAGKVNLTDIQMLFLTIRPQSTVLYLRLSMDVRLSVDIFKSYYCGNLCRSGYYQLHQLCGIAVIDTRCNQAAGTYFYYQMTGLLQMLFGVAEQQLRQIIQYIMSLLIC